MPTYDYHCSACQQYHEIFHSMQEPAKTQCPACSAHALERRISLGSGVIFKGSGFYETDYKRPAKPAESADSGHACQSGACKSCVA